MILQAQERVLRKVAKEVPVSDIKTPKIKKIIKEMSEALATQSDGVAIAAPQIGYSLRIFVISGKILDPDLTSNKEIKEKMPSDLIFINPKITKLSRDRAWVDEGCLSVRWLYGKTHRHKKATIEAYNEEGKRITRGASGILAQAFQHETDHLNGILFTDHAKDIVEHLPE